MDLHGASVVVTGGGSGIGEALAAGAVARGARAVVVADVDAEAAERVAEGLGPVARQRRCDVSDADSVRTLVEEAEAEHGGLDLVCSNAGIASGAGIDAAPETWDRLWAVNVMGSVNIANVYLEVVRRQGSGHLMITASAAGLLTNLGDAPCTATKHAAVGLAEWLSITHGEEGLAVSCLCPQGVRTPMVTGGLDAEEMAAEVVEMLGLIAPEECATAALDGIEADDFLILPHPEVARFQRAKADDLDRWLGGMRRLQSRLRPGD